MAVSCRQGVARGGRGGQAGATRRGIGIHDVYPSYIDDDLTATTTGKSLFGWGWGETVPSFPVV